MAFQLSDLIIAGEFHQTRPYSFHGRILLRGDDMPITVDLTGAPSADLRQRSFAFEVPANKRPATDADRARVKTFANQQVGTTGEITTARKFNGTEKGLYMEWFSQNGNVVLELPGVEVQFFEPSDDSASTFESHADPEDFDVGGETGHGALAEGEIFGDELDDSFDPESLPHGHDEDEAHAEEGYGLIPDELNRELERASRRLDREASGESEDVIREIEECELMDDLIENGEGEPITKLFAGMRLPKPADLATEDAAEQALKPALMQLALYGVAYDVCEHCSIREAYRILIDQVCVECTVYPEIRGTSWVQHFSTSDFCPVCQGKHE